MLSACAPIIPRLLASELANRAYFATFFSDRGDEFSGDFMERHDALLADQEAGTCVFPVLVGNDGTVLGRFNLVDLDDGTAELGYRVAQQVAGCDRGRTRTVSTRVRAVRDADAQGRDHP